MSRHGAQVYVAEAVSVLASGEVPSGSGVLHATAPWSAGPLGRLYRHRAHHTRHARALASRLQHSRPHALHNDGTPPLRGRNAASVPWTRERGGCSRYRPVDEAGHSHSTEQRTCAEIRQVNPVTRRALHTHTHTHTQLTTVPVPLVLLALLFARLL
jgi:hypothetical protein